jgi:hypothetical protein
MAADINRRFIETPLSQPALEEAGSMAGSKAGLTQRVKRRMDAVHRFVRGCNMAVANHAL